MDKEKHLAVFLRMMAVKEIRLARQSYSLLKSQANIAAEEYAKAGPAFAEMAYSDSVPKFNQILTASYALTIKDFASYTFQQIGKQSKTTFEQIILDYVRREALKKAKLISETSRDDLKKIIEKGTDEGLGQNAIAKLIRDKLTEYSQFRARTIARTETHNAATFGQLESAKTSGRPLMKEWLAANDARTRQAHAEADGQRVELDKDFVVGGEHIARPGLGSEENAINCRCTIIFIPKTIASFYE